MKYYFALFSLLCLHSGFSQQILNTAETASRTVSDPKTVILSPGFTANSQTVNPFIAKIGESSVQSVNAGTTNSTAGENNLSGQIGLGNFHDTKGDISVSGGGQLLFSLPIALPPSINGVAPQMNLSYSSGSGAGIAGMGFSISGINNISRVGKNIEKDGESKGVQLDYSDYFEFNGQRLLLKTPGDINSYGKDGTEYVTEKLSTLKVKSVGMINDQNYTGPNSFEVTFDNGSQAWYGTTPDSKNPVEYNIVKWKDAQGNYITYNYSKTNNVVVVSSVEWGGNEVMGTPHFNSIIFNYSSRNTKEVSFIHGVKFVQDKILTSVIVNANNQQFKKYVISHGIDEVVSNIIEYNSQNQAANPVYFSYQNSLDSNRSGVKNYDDNENNKVVGDFDGDGVLDYLKYFDGKPETTICLDFGESSSNRPECTKWGTSPAIAKGVQLIKSFLDEKTAQMLSVDVTQFSKEEFNKAVAITFKNSKNEISARQGIFITKEKEENGEFFIEGQIYAVNDNNQLVPQFDKPFVFKNSHKNLFTENQNGDYYSSTTITSMLMETRQLDLDGDGVSEIILNFNDFTSIEHRSNSDEVLQRKASTKRVAINQVINTYNYYRYLILNLNPTSSPSNTFKETATFHINIFDKPLIGDFKGDGKISILKIHGNSSYAQLFSFKKDKVSNDFSLETTEVPFVFKGLFDNAIVGDFNGDKKSDLIIPQADNSATWNLYLANGKGFKEEVKTNLVVFNKTIEAKDSCGFFDLQCKKFNERKVQSYQALDIDKDGKSELIQFKYDTRNYDNTRKLSYSDNTVRVFRNSGFNGTSDVNFSMMYQDYFRESGFHIFSELVGDFQINQVNNSIVLIGREAYNGISGKLYTYNFADRSKKALVKSITQGNLTTTIEYKELDSKVNPSFYAPIKKERYPIVELERVSQSFAVARLTQLDRKQDFIYRGLLAHVNGRGMIGFRKIARSNWYADGFENTKVWSATEIDPLQNGMVIKEWNTRNASDIFPEDVSLNTTQLLSLKLMEYTTEKSVTGVESILPYRSIEKDFLKNVTKESTIFYIGNFKVVDRVETSINGGYATTISKNEYFNDNLSGVGKDYYVGRIDSKSETIKAYGDTKKSKTAFTFENNLPKTITTFNQDESQTTTETYTYDGFGNVIEKNVSNSQDAQTQNIKNQYDSKGLFVIKTTDNLGLIAETTYNNYGQVLTQSDPLGNINTNTYDAWGKLTKSKSNLSGTTTYTYEKQGDDIVTSQYDPTGDIKETRTNKLGQQYQSMTKGFENGTYVFKKVEYDLVGRKIKESEPYFANEAPKWNTITYDDSVFPAKATVSSFNGAITETQVLGTTTLIKELNGYNRTTRKTTDVLGNQMESEDKGGIISFTYNAAGQNLKAIYGQNVVTTKYDTWGRKSEFHDPSNGKYSYAYNGFSQLLKETSPKGIKEYIYNNKGQLTAQKEMSTDDSAKATNKSITFTYNSKGMITDKKGTANGKDYLTYLTYDASGRVLTVSENSNGKYYFKKNIAYDDKGRVTSYDKGLYSSGILTQTTLENVYSSWSGAHYQLKDKNASKILWQLNTAKANGLVLKANLGNVAIENQYDGNNFLTKVVHASAVQPNVLQLTYAFDAIKNELKSRSRAGIIAINEVFSYDDNNRLTNWTNPKTGLISSNGYDEKGRILNNDQTGTTTFKNDKIYQAASQQLNAAGIQNFSNDIPQIITYNENNDPVYIDGQKGDAFFGYGLTEMRQSVTYGGNFNPEQGQQGKFTKYYSEDGSYEITTNNTTGQEKHILYLEGSPYESDIVFVKNYSDTAAKYLFLHKDYIGSILAITDEAGTAVEQRYFDAWGNLSSYATANGLTMPSTVAGSMLIDRGYTSHEHFTELGIIHMNGRLYDPLQRRFLNADENIQDPNNTQCYNKYGYAMNNPLLYNDPSGEIIPLLVAVIIGAAVGVASYAIGSYFTYGSWEKVGLSGALKAAFWGAVSGAVTFGIGECFTTVTGGIKAATAFSKTFGGVLVKAAAHGISQGTLAMMQNNGAGFLSGASGGFFGSLGATAWGGAGGKWGGIGGKYASTTVGTIAFGSLSGGVGAELSGGNFWKGAVTGGIVSGLNHALHQIDPPGKKRDPLVRADGSRITNADVNGDGKVALIELEYWYRNGGGTAININASSLSMEGVDPNLFKGMAVGDHIGINLLFSDFWGGEGALYGELDFEYRGGNQVRIASNEYNFDVGADVGHPWFNSWSGFARNVSTVLGNIAAGSGTGFMINFKGNATLNFNPNK